MRFPSSIVRTFGDVQRNFDYLRKQMSIGAFPLVRTFDVAGVSSLDLGAYDGQNITGVRITVAGEVLGNGGDTFVRLRVNGLSTMNMACIAQRIFWQAGVASSDLAYASNIGAGTGFVLCPTNFLVGNSILAEHVLMTRVIPPANQHRRHMIGIYSNEDTVNTANNYLNGRIQNVWNDWFTIVSSLQMTVDSGLFHGRVSTQIIP